VIVADYLVDVVIRMAAIGVAMGVWLVVRWLVDVARKSDRFDIW
jgi:hypothetical protein